MSERGTRRSDPEESTLISPPRHLQEDERGQRDGWHAATNPATQGAKDIVKRKKEKVANGHREEPRDMVILGNE